MRIRCSHCGNAVSSDVPDGVIIRARVQCLECSKKQAETVTTILKDALVECPSASSSEAIILFDSSWHALKWGCDTFDHLRDNLLSAFGGRRKDD